MRSVSYPRTVVAALVVSGALLASSLVAASSASSGAAAAVAKPPKTVTATLIKRRSGTLAPGTSVGSAKVAGQRVFTDANHGFALASVGSADYPVATGDAGKTWKTDGPALHLHAAQAPLAVAFIGAVTGLGFIAGRLLTASAAQMMEQTAPSSPTGWQSGQSVPTTASQIGGTQSRFGADAGGGNG